MKFYLCVVLLATAFLAAEGKAAPTTRELVELLQKIIERDLDENDLNELHSEIHQKVQGHAAEFADTPVFQVPVEVLGGLFIDIAETMSSHIPEEMTPIVAARFTEAFMTVLINNGMDHVWEMASQHLIMLTELDGGNDMQKKSSIAKQVKRWDKREAPSAGDNVEYWTAVFDVLIAPNQAVLQDIYEMMSEVDTEYYGNFFVDMYYMAEDDALLSRSLDQSAIDVGESLAVAMYTPSAHPDPADLAANVIGRMGQWVNEVQELSVDDALERVDLKPKEKEAMGNLLRGIIPLIEEFVEPAKTLLQICEYNPDKMPRFFVGVLGHILEEQYNELRMILPAIQHGAEVKADVIGRLIATISSGKGEDFFIALFTKMAHHAVNDGYDLDRYMTWAGDLLDQLDADFSDAGKKRALKMKNLRRFSGSN
ncbi:hypothetical protein CAPTEDRAFT_227120 [Capitella teleta]|uniref:Uncharacterized protein n=1 Tax=Capitella teleta TaxID=283909 RepID=R7U498_CAPTE|nr:hypothetical protein CAPTEDRAFT_227120 [Capitella teleta]|eukprot:ELT97995.1 hypothetical protein CAPTEDRAFT_227120 [Capitella teleta]